MNPVKNAIHDLVDICRRKGLKYVVISPGSRNAPIADEFLRDGNFNCISIVDERSAGFFALGMAQQLLQPVILLCSSGTAVLNYAPAIAEAYYQQIPLLVLTADRPKEWIDQGESQTIDQQYIFRNYIKKSFILPQNPEGETQLWHNGKLLSEAINTTQLAPPGPVHVNMSLDEPLYGESAATGTNPRIIDVQTIESRLTASGIDELRALAGKSKKIMVLTGLLTPQEKLNTLLENFAGSSSVTVLTETTGNLYSEKFIPCIDRVLATISKDETESFMPDLLITMGHQVISKRIKAMLRSHRPVMHWHVDTTQLHHDTYKSLTLSIPLTPEAFLEQLGNLSVSGESNYAALWQKKFEVSEKRHEAYLSSVSFSDLKVFHNILEHLPENSILQMGNSSPVRYIQLFRNRPSVKYYSNRGTSGIEGCTSTAAGAAYISQQPTVLVTGDLGFLYDNNGLWNNYLSGKLKIIVINNGGGGIFRFIEGPETVTSFETYIETTHDLKVELLAKLHGLVYFYAENEKMLEAQLKLFFDNNDQPGILEIKTPRLENATILRKYFEYLNKGI